MRRLLAEWWLHRTGTVATRRRRRVLAGLHRGGLTGVLGRALTELLGRALTELHSRAALAEGSAHAALADAGRLRLLGGWLSLLLLMEHRDELIDFFREMSRSTLKSS